MNFMTIKIIGAAILACALMSTGFADQTKPNIVLFYLDDWAWNGTPIPMEESMENSAMPILEMPNLEKLAKQGMKFSNAYGSHQCAPARYSLQTGMSGPRTGFTLVLGKQPTGDYDTRKMYEKLPLVPNTASSGLAPDAITIPEVLKPFGYVKVILKDILIGDVWVLGGQSNMARAMQSYAWLMQRKPTLEENDQIRLFRLDSRTHSETPSKKVVTHPDFKGSWQLCKREYLDDFSPLGYFFAIHRYKMNQVPIGLIYACRGATCINSWVDRSLLEANPAYALFLDPEQNSNCLPKNGEPNPQRPSALYNGMVYPVMPYTIKGVLWNQGESDSKWPHLYKTLFPEMIRSWRETWGQGDFPFVYAQLSSSEDRTWALIKNPREDSWAWQREAQCAALTEPNTAMVAAYDLGEWDDIHPQDKETLAKRYVLAVAKLDGDDVVFRIGQSLSGANGCGRGYESRMTGLVTSSTTPTIDWPILTGPAFKSHTIDGNKVIITFDNLCGGLMTRRVVMNRNKGLAPGTDPEAFVAPEDKLTGFILCGADKVFHDADAQIVGDTVVLSCPDIPNPVAARYA